MTTQWSRFNKRANQTILDLGGAGVLDVYNGTGGYQGIGEGDEYFYPEISTSDPELTLDAETMAPSAFAGVEDKGTFEAIDQLAFVAPGLEDRTFRVDITIRSDETHTYDVVTVPNGVTLTVNGTLRATQVDVSGTLDNNGTVNTIDDSGDESTDPDDIFTPFGHPDRPPTRVHLSENDEVFELETLSKQGDGYARLDLSET